jgi:hypothetical protein
VEADVACSADLDLSAGAKLPGGMTDLMNEFGGAAELGGGAKFQASGGANIAGRISLAVVTTTIAAIGEGDTHSQWVLHRKDRPLIGNHCFVQVALVPPVVKQMSMECRVSAAVTSAFGLFPDKRRSDWARCGASTRPRRPLDRNRHRVGWLGGKRVQYDYGFPELVKKCEERIFINGESDYRSRISGARWR